jgi:hypothetical protein
MTFVIAPIRLLACLCALALAISVASRDAQAYPFYIDFQAGAGRYTDTTTALFNSGVSGTSDVGLAFNLGFFYTPLEPKHGFDFQLGIEGVYLNSQQGTHYYSTAIPYLTARVQLMMLYGSVGLAPLIWRRGELGPGIDNLGLASSTLAYFAEVGALYAATPKFSMGGALNFQFFSNAGILSMSPATSLTFVMRFYFNIFDIGSDSAGVGAPLEYEGWRYIGK